MTNKIFNESCVTTLVKMIKNNIQVDLVLTSPFYNTNKKAGKSRTLNNITNNGYPYVRYDSFVDNMDDDTYRVFIKNIFDKIDVVLAKNGVILWQCSYGAEGAQKLIDNIYFLGKTTNFTCADIITWKKDTALPNNMSFNKATRITEYVFVFCRRDEYDTFFANKKVVSVRKTGQKNYSSFYNFIQAKNNDGPCKLNKATFSTELCTKLLDIYSEKGKIVYDPFIGTGTTAIAALEKGMSFIGSEISKDQYDYACKRIADYTLNKE